MLSIDSERRPPDFLAQKVVQRLPVPGRSYSYLNAVTEFSPYGSRRPVQQPELPGL